MKYRLLSMIFAILTAFSVVCHAADTATQTEAETEAQTEEKSETTAEEEINYLPPDIVNVNAACVYNIENDMFIYELDADDIIYPASTVKLMTAIVAIEALGNDLTREITVNGGALVGVEGNRVGLKNGEVLTFENLLYALVCGCANDAANALAIEVAGSVEAFTILMNEKAKEIGAVNTRYTNVTGMHHPEMVTTARDTAIIATYAYNLAPICEMASVEKFVIPPTNKAKERTVFNKNYYFSTNMEYLYIWKIPRGLNAGYTPEGGYCLATTATRNGLTYVVVCMGALDDGKYIYSYTEAADLIKWAFNAYSMTKVLATSSLICEVPVRLSSTVDSIGLYPAENIELFLPNGIDVSRDISLKWELNRDAFIAPVSEGEIGGRLTVTYDGKNLGSYDLITKSSVSRNNFLYVFDLVYDLIISSAFTTVIVCAAGFLALYLLGLLAAKIIREKNRRNRR